MRFELHANISRLTCCAETKFSEILRFSQKGKKKIPLPLGFYWKQPFILKYPVWGFDSSDFGAVINHIVLLHWLHLFQSQREKCLQVLACSC